MHECMARIGERRKGTYTRMLAISCGFGEFRLFVMMGKMIEIHMSDSSECKIPAAIFWSHRIVVFHCWIVNEPSWSVNANKKIWKKIANFSMIFSIIFYFNSIHEMINNGECRCRCRSKSLFQNSSRRRRHFLFGISGESKWICALAIDRLFQMNQAMNINFVLSKLWPFPWARRAIIVNEWMASMVLREI